MIKIEFKNTPDCLKRYFKSFAATTLCGVIPEERYTKVSDNIYKIDITYHLPENGNQDDCYIEMEPDFTPDFHWSPHLTPEEGYIAEQHIYRTPALIAMGGGKTAAVVPDIDTVYGQDTRSYLDIDAISNKLFIGMSESVVDGHVLYKKAKGAKYVKGAAAISFFVLVYDEELANPFRNILSFFWNRYGHRHFIEYLGNKNDLEAYCGHTYDWAFKNWKNIVWQEFELNGKNVGAPVFIVTTFQSPNYRGVAKERELRSIWNQAWFCSLRSAAGLFRYARRMERKDLLEYALKTKELALAFPQRDGLFDSVIATDMETFVQEEEMYRRSLGWNTAYFGNSDRNPLKLNVKNAPGHILDMSFTAYYMLVWYGELEADERLAAYARTYADKLVALQYDSGFFPAWLKDGESTGILDESPETSMSVAFLLKCYKTFCDEKYLKSAVKAMDAVVDEIVFSGRWEDFETYWSCGSFWNDKVGQKIPRNNMYKQCNFSMFFTALALIDMYEATGDKKYILPGQRVLDEMLMTQSSFQPVNMPLPTIGGFGVLNADAELNDARQSLFAETIIRYGKLLENNEYIERGLAAIRISFSMMYCPENPQTKLQWEKAYPFLNEKDYGFNMENYGHNGFVDSEGLGIGEFTIYDWGNGAACESWERLLDHFGRQFMTNGGKV